ncbi:SDR family oxidoreductase [Rhizobium sp. NFR03]|uniref:SDR family NAD(P)-dependent oxidoreductase n=1 Tax=Rhizobium sp. NFR03 TaxID=1566263 RepID=UPI0008CBE784|nr:SDR family oxidoreductase [Rhizobium sp. NFR03]SES42618.1 glucose 1-dehydrogenase [Rhizobium sp. NFR03]
MGNDTENDPENFEPGPGKRVKALAGRIAIVTGSDSGIGRAVAEAFALEGADVAVTYHTDDEGARATAAQVEAAGCRSFVQSLDVRDEASVMMLMGSVEERLGLPDILVNCAGIGGSKPFVETSFEDFDNVIKTDLYGPFFFCREFVRRRQGRRGGKIINVTSVHEAIPSPGITAYGAAKGGLLTLTRSLAMEFAEQRINVNAIAPGLIRTPMTMERTDDPEKRAEEMLRIPWHRPGEPWEVARLAVYLASDDADYVTGQSFTIDGGLEMNWGQGA